MDAVAPTQSLERRRDLRDIGYEFAPAGRRRTASSVRRRAAWLTIMMWGAAGGLVLMVALFLFFAGVFDMAVPVPPELEGRQVARETLTMGELQYNGYDKKNQSYALNADQAQQDAAQPNIIHLDNVRAELKIAGSGEVIFVRSARGAFDTETEVLRLEGDIKVVTTNGYTAYLETATVTLKQGLVSTDDPVVVMMERGTVWSNGMRLWDNARRMEFVNRVRVEFGGSGREDSGRQNAG